ncbi:MAG TPA: hypothetical protein VM184_05715 [Gaiellaceae bacterium]|nr:hypothetical protein [Gaiellaceae bacterium]
MRRPLLLAAVLLLAGCGEAPQEPFLAARAAEPQRVELGWREAYPDGPKRLLFAVDELAVTARGWSVRIAVTNDTAIPFTTRDRDVDLTYGVTLFRTGDLDELEAAAEAGFPPVRKASAITPMPPSVLRPGATWRATLSGRGALADGAWLRVVFGPFRADGDPPEGMQPAVVWITDRSHRL